MKSYDHEAAFDVPGNEIPLKLPVISSARCAHVGSNYASVSLSLSRFRDPRKKMLEGEESFAKLVGRW